MEQRELTQLYQQQIREFSIAGKNYAALQKNKQREITFREYSIRLQYNPARILSTNASVDPDSIRARNCFLCPSSRPEGQTAIPYGEHYQILLNPYPIFPEHFTVPTTFHTPQLISGRFGDLLDLTFDFPAYTSFYNGPSCGASAPDHFHFQMVPRHHMPLETDVTREPLRQIITKKDFYSISTLRNYLRKTIILQASAQPLLTSLFNQCLDIIGNEIPADTEPMINLLCWFDNCQWTVCIFPRRCRRPWQFSAQEEEKILFSPGCVDMAGLIIVPREKDYNKYSTDLLTDLFRQVCPDEKSWHNILQQLQKIK